MTDSLRFWIARLVVWPFWCLADAGAAAERAGNRILNWGERAR